MDGYKNQKEKYAREVTLELYEKGFIQTLYNGKSEKRDEGWILKNGSWSPLYINLRQIGDEPMLVEKIGKALSLMFISEEAFTYCNKVVGIEMAGIPIAVATSIAGKISGEDSIPYLYTRPLAEKVRTVEEACALLEKERAGDYGEKYFLEGRLQDRDNLCLIDDVAMDFESKLIAREIVRYVAERRGVQISCNSSLVVFDREQGAQEVAEKEGMSLRSLIKFKSQALDWLQQEMKSEERALIIDYLNDTGKYQNRDVQREALERARKFLETS